MRFPRIRFSIRTLLVLAMVSALAIYVYRRHQANRAVVQHFESLGGTVYYPSGNWDWFHARTGFFFSTPVELDLGHSRAGDGDLEQIGRLKNLERLYLNRTQIGVDDLQNLAELPRLKRLALWGNRRIGDLAIDQLLRCRTLEAIDVSDTGITPAAIGRLGELPRLNHLVFSPHYIHSESMQMGPRTIRQLARVRRRVPVGECFLHNADAASIQLFCRSDTSRVSELLFRDCELTDDACRAIAATGVARIDIQNCEFDGEQLGLLRAGKMKQLDLFNRKGRSEPDVTVGELTKVLPNGLERVAIFPEYMEFHYTDSFVWRFRLHGSIEALDPQLVQAWLERGLQSIHLGREAHVEANLSVLEDVNPRIELSLHHQQWIWQRIQKLTRLWSLRVYGPGTTTPKFTEAMTLTSLYLKGDCDPSREWMAEIAKLSKLEWLEVQSSVPVTVETIEPLRKLVRMRTIIIDQVDQNGEALIEEITSR